MSGNKIDEMMGNVVMSDELKNRIREGTNGKVVRYRRPAMKRMVLVATICVAILGTMTVVAANNAEKIEKYFMNILGYDADTQKELEEEGFYQNVELAYNEGDIVAATNDGITVALKETIVDKSVIKALIQIRAEEGVELDESSYFEEWFVKGTVIKTPGQGQGPYEYFSAMEYAMEGTENLEGEWCIVIIENYIENGLKTGDIVEIEFNNIFKFDYDNGGDKKIISDGEWTLKWELNVNEKCVQIPVNETIETNNLKYPIDYVQITPCSLKICFSECLDEWLGYKPLKINLHMKDGSVCEINGIGGVVNSMFGNDWYGFRSALSLDNIEKISIEGKEYPVSE